MKNLLIFTSLVLLFLCYINYSFAEENLDSWDEESKKHENDKQFDPWDNSAEDVERMKGDLPENVFAVIHLSSKNLTSSIVQFLQYELNNYPRVIARDIKSKTPMIRYFSSEAHLSQFTLFEALANDAIPEEKMDEVKKIKLPSQEEILKMPLASFDISEQSLQDITASLVNHNIRRVENTKEDDIDVDDDSFEGSDHQSDDGEVGSDKNGKQKEDQRTRRARRLKKMKKQSKTKQRKKKEFKPKIRLGDRFGLHIPPKILYFLCFIGLSAIAYLIYSLYQTIENNTKIDEEKRQKIIKRNQKKMKRYGSKKKKQ